MKNYLNLTSHFKVQFNIESMDTYMLLLLSVLKHQEKVQDDGSANGRNGVEQDDGRDKVALR